MERWRANRWLVRLRKWSLQVSQIYRCSIYRLEKRDWENSRETWVWCFGVSGRDRKYKFSFILFLPTVKLNSTRLDHPISSEIYSRRSLIEVSFQIKILISARDDKLKTKHGSIGLKIKMRGKQLAIIFFLLHG